nr:YihY/virulence factor BrkB family protein [Halorientalis brevis]
MAGSVAYQAFMSLLPLIVVLYLLVAMVAGEQLAARVLELTEAVLPTETRQLLATAVSSQIATTATSIVSLAILLWGAIGLFRTFQTAFARIYETTTKTSRVDQLLDALVTFSIVLVATLAAAGAATASVVVRVPFFDLVSATVLLVGLVVAFLPMYYLFPNTALPLRNALPGALIAAGGWTLLQWTFQLYLQHVSSPNVAGALGAILVLLTWLYYGSYLVLFGAVVNASLAGPPPSKPSADAVADVSEGG